MTLEDEAQWKELLDRAHTAGWPRFDAGIVPPRTSSQPTRPCRPRACGDGPRHCRLPRSMPVGPAPAGMVRSPGQGWRGSRPRACGDGPRQRPRAGRPIRRPRACGDGPRSPTRGVHGEVGPAPAGMVRRRVDGRRHDNGRPRACGDGPWPAPSIAPAARSAPRLRGWSGALSRPVAEVIVGPAPAGMVPCHADDVARSARRPRACGDGPAARRVAGAAAVGPAPAGMVLDSPLALGGARVGPAPAGMVPSRRVAGALGMSAPRLRGWSMTPTGILRCRGSAPRLRGWSRATGRTSGGIESAPRLRGWSCDALWTAERAARWEAQSQARRAVLDVALRAQARSALSGEAAWWSKATASATAGGWATEPAEVFAAVVQEPAADVREAARLRAIARARAERQKGREKDQVTSRVGSI